MPLSDLSVKSVPKSYLDLIPSGTKNYTDARASVLPTNIGCTNGATLVYPVLQILHLFRPIRRGDYLDGHYILAPWRWFGLVILMVDWTWRLDGRLVMAS